MGNTFTDLSQLKKFRPAETEPPPPETEQAAAFFFAPTVSLTRRKTEKSEKNAVSRLIIWKRAL